MLYPCTICNAMPYHTYHKYVGLFAAFSRSRPLSLHPLTQSSHLSVSAPTFSTSKHAFTSFYSDLLVDFISSSFFFCFSSFGLCWEWVNVCVCFYIIFIHITCLRMYIQIWKRATHWKREREREKEKRWNCSRIYYVKVSECAHFLSNLTNIRNG